jgi:hypothetical protein
MLSNFWLVLQVPEFVEKNWDEQSQISHNKRVELDLNKKLVDAVACGGCWSFEASQLFASGFSHDSALLFTTSS